MFLINNHEHAVGDRKCTECWVGFPQKCECHGLIHCEFVKEHWQGDKVLAYSCDACGENYRFPMQEGRKKFGGRKRTR